MPLKEADKVRAQVLALLDTANIEAYVASMKERVPISEQHAVREFAAYLRRQIAQGATDSSFAIS